MDWTHQGLCFFFKLLFLSWKEILQSNPVMEFVGPFENDLGRRSWGFVKDDEGHAGSWLWETIRWKSIPTVNMPFVPWIRHGYIYLPTVGSWDWSAISETSIWPNYSDLTRPILPQMVVNSKGNPLFRGKSRFVDGNQKSSEVSPVEVGSSVYPIIYRFY